MENPKLLLPERVKPLNPASWRVGTHKASTVKGLKTISGWKNRRDEGVRVMVRTPTAGELKSRLNESRALTVRLGTAFTKKGVKLSVNANTPKYAADAKDPGVVVQKVGKKIIRGTFDKNGTFIKAA